MDLGNPNALWLLLLVAALLLARRRKPRARLAVGNIYLWQQMAPRAAASLLARLRRSWLLVLQVAFVLAAIAALTRPILPVAAGRVALILDVSASMGAQDGSATRLDVAKARAVTTAQTWSRATRVLLIAAGAVPQTIGDYGTGDPRLAQAIQSLQLTAERADLPAAIQTAVAGEETSAAIYVFTDQVALSESRTPAPESGAPSPGSRINWVHIGHPADNAAIVHMAVRRLPSRPRDGQVLVEAQNYGATGIATEVEVAMNDSVVTRLPVRLQAREGLTVVADVPGVNGVISARLAGRDALAVDNLRLAIVPPLKPIRVLLVGGTFFLEKALSVNPGLVVERISLEALAATSRASPASSAYDVLVCEGCTSLPVVKAGVLFIPASKARARAPSVLSVTQPGHPVANGLDLSGLSALAIGSNSSEDNAEVIARAGEHPALLAYEENDRRIVEVRVDPTNGDLPLSPAFPLLIANAIDWLTARKDNLHEISAGESLNWVLPPGRVGQATKVVGPNGRVLAASVAGNHLTFPATHAAGLYRVQAGDSEDPFVVNPVTEAESDLTEDLGTRAPRPGSRVDAPYLVAETMSTSETVAPFLLIALLLLGVEWWYRLQLPNSQLPTPKG
jgi:hypothetical protein